MRTHSSSKAVTWGIDIGKTVFHVVGTAANGKPVQKAKFSRRTLFEFFSNAEKTLIGMEACPGSQWLARKLISLGHTVRIMPAQFVKPSVKTNKNDTIDAQAIAEAVTRPTMRFVQVKQCTQVDMQALHRVRDKLMSNRTALICQMRAFLLEYGIAMKSGPGAFKHDFPAVLEDAENDLTVAMRHILSDLCQSKNRVDNVTAEINALSATDDNARRLMTIPGIGAPGASAIIAAVGDARQFRKARDMAAWLGLVLAQFSTGGKSHLLGISKRGNPYVRRLLRSCVMHRDRLGTWINTLSLRLHHNN